MNFLDLEFEKAKPGEPTMLDLVREYLPDVSENDADYILWNHTSYPFGGEAEIRRHLAAFSRIKE